MWICNRCQTANKEGYTQCVQCSAPRNARRFGAGRPVVAPSVQTAAPERRMQPPEPTAQEAPPPPVSRRAAQASPAPPRRAAGGFIRLVGILLSVLMPILTVLLAVLRHDVISPVISGLFFKPPVPEVLGYVAYVLMAFVAALLAMAPGLALVALSRLMGLARRR